MSSKKKNSSDESKIQGIVSQFMQDPSLKEEAKQIDVVIESVKSIYKKKLKPLEKAYRFGEFYSPMLSDADFDAAPMVLLLGQYSVGKTTFIKYLLERDFPGMRIGPEPTTDCFMAIMKGNNERIIPGNALAADIEKPFQGLNKFGVSFLNHITCAELNSPILSKITMIDTPGVLAGEKQRVGRAYDFPRVIEWFSQRCDRILILFDAHKLDVSDEMKRVIEVLKNSDNVRVILNKADQVTSQQLMRVYGALMWSLGKVFQRPEVLRVYIGSFWDEPYKNTENIPLFQREREDLLNDLRSLPRNSTLRKINELVKRTRYSKVHAYICNHLRNQFSLFYKQSKQEKLLKNMLQEFKMVSKQHGLAPGDFPDVNRFRSSLERFEIWKFPKLYTGQMTQLDTVLSKEIPALMKILPMVEKQKMQQAIENGTYEDTEPGSNPFGSASPLNSAQEPWAITGPMKMKFDNIFNEQKLTSGGKLTGANAKPYMLKSCLPAETLGLIWELSDMDKDGCLDDEEFAICVYLIEAIKSGAMSSVPSELPTALVPPSKRSKFSKNKAADDFV
uniref:Calmodulin n=1 Tax=Norrisiella sphaerica TaxID=552664 RepID=A0A7S2QS49_9EUKA|mmetsp:Transcript_1593/g.2277  ORF Transcript_1593/g.2277 Transcript_1593/m.2277 type:complete len:561 (+) Transcript_1593:142-1824(+)|eukprot:CAMPEP_0184493262 /NCGR_PEP_ID=MMETSP0113_2-20130426/25503_1 /TAXON_ID=91329 /ORGANISM="Norrisiella sphaerica, Strain BC52" /LENGTH=560 /DNA_ID=CAMNT_0026878463 /DNA_START=66 /DNA_END=1748 /DNA_ORIENTATION=+